MADLIESLEEMLITNPIKISLYANSKEELKLRREKRSYSTKSKFKS